MREKGRQIPSPKYTHTQTSTHAPRKLCTSTPSLTRHTLNIHSIPRVRWAYNAFGKLCPYFIAIVCVWVWVCFIWFGLVWLMMCFENVTYNVWNKEMYTTSVYWLKQKWVSTIWSIRNGIYLCQHNHIFASINFNGIR